MESHDHGIIKPKKFCLAESSLKLMKTLSYFLLLPAFAFFGTSLHSQEPVEDTPSPFGKPAPADTGGGKDANASKPAVDEKTASELRSVIKQNLHAWTTENMALLRSTTHSESPLLETNTLMAKHLFDNFKLRYTQLKATPIKADEEEAQVEIIQSTEKMDGIPAFRNNVQYFIHTLRKENNDWKIYSTKGVIILFMDSSKTRRDEALKILTTLSK